MDNSEIPYCIFPSNTLLFSVMNAYENLKIWRGRAKNRGYAAKYMKIWRTYYRQAYLKGDIKYDDIPKAYRYFTDSKNPIQ